MSDEKKCTNNEELCEGKKELTQEELEQVNGGGVIVPVKDEDIPKLNTTEALQGRVAGVVILSTGQPCAGEDIRVR